MIVVIGVDPGPTTGVCVLKFESYEGLNPLLFQVNHLWALDLLANLVNTYNPRFIAVEDWAPGKGRGSDVNVTRSLIDEIVRFYPNQVSRRTASVVKSWATDKRLYAVSSEFKRDTTGMRHARDAGRHALFCAVHDAGMPDPLSRKAKVL